MTRWQWRTVKVSEVKPGAYLDLSIPALIVRVEHDLDLGVRFHYSGNYTGVTESVWMDPDGVCLITETGVVR